jgi:ABC-type transport system involved in cytochrome c biogenesis permease component
MQHSMHHVMLAGLLLLLLLLRLLLLLLVCVQPAAVHAAVGAARSTCHGLPARELLLPLLLLP